MNEKPACGPEGRYANFAQIAYTEDEFVLEFGQMFQETREATIHTRIIVSPVYARVLLDTLAQAVGKYEQTYGNQK